VDILVFTIKFFQLFCIFDTFSNKMLGEKVKQTTTSLPFCQDSRLRQRYGKHLTFQEKGGLTEVIHLSRILNKLFLEFPFNSIHYIKNKVLQVTPEAPAHPCLLWHYSQ
jgi:hypothetical protein